MRLAIAIWNGRVSPVFDVAQQIVIVDSERAGQLPSVTPIALLPGLARVEQLTSLKINALICGGISCALHRQIEARGIEVIPNVTGEIPEVLMRYARGELQVCPRRKRCRTKIKDASCGMCRRLVDVSKEQHIP